jgi:hypothetical protein
MPRPTREALKADIIPEAYKQRADWMRAGGFWLMLLFAVPLAVWWAAVILYSACSGVPGVRSRRRGPLPPCHLRLMSGHGQVVISIFGVIGADRWGRK